MGAVAVTAALLPALLVACGGSSDESSATQSATNTFPQSNEPANLNPADFTTQIDNPYFPLPVGRAVGRPRDRPGGDWSSTR